MYDPVKFEYKMNAKRVSISVAYENMEHGSATQRCNNETKDHILTWFQMLKPERKLISKKTNQTKLKSDEPKSKPGLKLLWYQWCGKIPLKQSSTPQVRNTNPNLWLSFINKKPSLYVYTSIKMTSTNMEISSYKV